MRVDTAPTKQPGPWAPPGLRIVCMIRCSQAHSPYGAWAVVALTGGAIAGAGVASGLGRRGWRGPRAPGAQVDFAWPDPGPHGGRLARAGGRSLLTHFLEKNEAGVSLGFAETSRCLPEPRKGPQERPVQFGRSFVASEVAMPSSTPLGSRPAYDEVIHGSASLRCASRCPKAFEWCSANRASGLTNCSTCGTSSNDSIASFKNGGLRLPGRRPLIAVQCPPGQFRRLSADRRRSNGSAGTSIASPSTAPRIAAATRTPSVEGCGSWWL